MLIMYNTMQKRIPCGAFLKERVECYPKVRVRMVNIRSKGCEACELHRNGRFCVRLSGQLYHNHTLQEDQFMPDDSQVTSPVIFIV